MRDDPVKAAAALVAASADELHISCPAEAPPQLLDLVARTSRSLSIPLLVSAEPASLDEIAKLLDAGATRVAFSTAALGDPNFIQASASRFGSASVAVAVEVEPEHGYWRVVAGAERRPTEWDALNWARVIEAQGAGELLLRSPSAVAEPYDLELIRAVTAAVAIPVVAIGEARGAEDLFDALMTGDADGALIGLSLVSERSAIRDVKRYLAEHGLSMRLESG